MSSKDDTGRIFWLVLDEISCVTWLIYRSHRRWNHVSYFLNLQQPVEFKIVRTEKYLCTEPPSRTCPMTFSGQMVACGRQLTHKHRCASIGRLGTKGLRPLLNRGPFSAYGWEKVLVSKRKRYSDHGFKCQLYISLSICSHDQLMWYIIEPTKMTGDVWYHGTAKVLWHISVIVIYIYIYICVCVWLHSVLRYIQQHPEIILIDIACPTLYYTLWYASHSTHWDRDKMAAISQTTFSS